jgi:chromosome segregation ATPase
LEALDGLKEELDHLKKEVEELKKEIIVLKKAVSFITSTMDLLSKESKEPIKEDLGEDTWDPSIGAIPKGMKPDKKFHVAVKRREDVKTVEKGGY